MITGLAEPRDTCMCHYAPLCIIVLKQQGRKKHTIYSIRLQIPALLYDFGVHVLRLAPSRHNGG